MISQVDCSRFGTNICMCCLCEGSLTIVNWAQIVTQWISWHLRCEDLVLSCFQEERYLQNYVVPVMVVRFVMISMQPKQLS
jgi:hypothetical protein